MVDESTAVLIALIAVGGTLVAGALGQLTLLRLNARREDLDRRRRAREVLRAIRVIDEEMGWSMRVLKRARQEEAWWQPGQGPALDAWREHAPDVAGELAPTTWAALARAAMAVRVLLRIRAELDAQPQAAETWQRVDAEADAAADLIREARILVRPVLLGGSTLPKTVQTPGGTWFPAVPELGPSEVWSKTRLLRYRWRRRRGARQPPNAPDDVGATFDIFP